MASRVCGLVLRVRSQCWIADRSYEWPSSATTGSAIIESVMGHVISGGASSAGSSDAGERRRLGRAAGRRPRGEPGRARRRPRGEPGVREARGQPAHASFGLEAPPEVRRLRRRVDAGAQLLERIY